jgi:hypothetical protein
MNRELAFILCAGFGALCLELLQWVELRKNISDKEKELLSSKFYWVLTVTMIVLSGVGTWLLFYETNMQLKVPFVLGAAFPAIFKKVAALAQDRQPHLGAASSNVSFGDVAKKYFQ